MTRKAARQRLSIGLSAALIVNAALLALLAPAGREVIWPTPAATEVAIRVELMRKPQRRSENEPATATVSRRFPEVQPSTKTSTGVSAQSRPVASAAAKLGSAAAIPAPPTDQGAKTGGAQGGGAADLRAKTALALRKLGACSRVNSGAGDAQDRELCSANFAAANGPSLDSIPGDKRADYDAAHARAGYLVPADAANPNFVTSQFKRGGTVVTGHAGCALVEGKWSCVGH